MDLWEQACDIFLHDHLDYSIWRFVLQQMSTLVPALSDIELERTVSAALNTMKLRSGYAMEAIWVYHRPLYDGQLRGQRLSFQLDNIAAQRSQTTSLGVHP